MIHAFDEYKNKVNPYPVGAIYLSVDNTNPATLFGGTWEQIKDKFLLCAGDTYSAGGTGGEATHILSPEEMGNHSHLFNQYKNKYSYISESAFNQNDLWSDTDQGFYIPSTEREYGQTTTPMQSESFEPVYEPTPMSKMPPYLTVYVWKRTA